MARTRQAPTGKEGCQCIDASSTLASLTDRSCTTRDGEAGVIPFTSRACYPHSYGSNSCLLHDVKNDPLCNVTSSSGQDMPDYCGKRWCYVDAGTCMGDSEERVYRSNMFPPSMGVDVDLFWSSSTCDSSANQWLDYVSQNVLGGPKLKATVGHFNVLPWVYKRNADGIIPPVPGSEYFNNSVPFEGVHVEYLETLEGVADGDFMIEWVHGSRAALAMYPGSPGNAAVQDVADGLIDIAVAPFWITPPRLKLTAFTTPISNDRTVLVIPQPGYSKDIQDQMLKVFDPFSWGVWGLILGTIMVTAFLSLWFSGTAERRSRQSGYSRRSVYSRLAVDEFLQKGMFFCSAGIEQDTSASLSHKILMFGFGFFILIVVSAYVANLAAFLTRNSFDHVGTFEEAVAEGWKICAHPVLKEDLENAHPNADFVFNYMGKELYGLIDDWDADKCQAMAIGETDSLGDIKLLNLLCERNLVYTDSLIIEVAMGFPVRSDLAQGINYWMAQAEKYHGSSIEASLEQYNAEYRVQPNCNVILSEQSNGEEGNESEYTAINAPNLIFPIIFFLCSASIAVILQLCQTYKKREISDQDLPTNTLMPVGRYSSINFHITRSLRNLGKRQISLKKDEEDAPLDGMRRISMSMPNHGEAQISLNEDGEDAPLDTSDKIQHRKETEEVSVEARDVFTENGTVTCQLNESGIASDQDSSAANHQEK